MGFFDSLFGKKEALPQEEGESMTPVENLAQEEVQKEGGVPSETPEASQAPAEMSEQQLGQ